MYHKSDLYNLLYHNWTWHNSQFRKGMQSVHIQLLELLPSISVFMSNLSQQILDEWTQIVLRKSNSY